MNKLTAEEHRTAVLVKQILDETETKLKALPVPAPTTRHIRRRDQAVLDEFRRKGIPPEQVTTAMFEQAAIVQTVIGDSYVSSRIREFLIELNKWQQIWPTWFEGR